MDDGHTDNGRPTQLLHADLTYKLIGFIYRINDSIGFGQTEKVYCEALAKLFEEHSVSFQREVYYPIKMDGKLIAKRYFDFLVDNRVIVEMKVGDYKYKETCGQLFGYLKLSGYKLGLIVRFTRNGVRVKRIPCFY